MLKQAVLIAKSFAELIVSTPLDWEEVNPKLNPADFTIRNIQQHPEKAGDLRKLILGNGQNILKALEKLQAANS